MYKFLSMSWHTCFTCQGTGKVYEDVCGMCGGTGEEWLT